MPATLDLPLDTTSDGDLQGVILHNPSIDELLHEIQNPVAKIWVVTSGAVWDPVDHPERAQLWGVGRVAALENPRMWGGLIDVPEELDEKAAARLVAVLAGDEDQVADPRGRRVRPPSGARAQALGSGGWTPRGTVLITRGTGALGGQVARLAGRATSAERLILASRRGPDAPGVGRAGGRAPGHRGRL